MFAQSQLYFFKFYFLISQKLGINVYYWSKKNASLEIQKSPYINTFHRFLCGANIGYGILVTVYAFQLLGSGTSSNQTSTLLNLIMFFGTMNAIIFAISNFKNSSDLAKLVNEILQHELRHDRRLSNNNNKFRDSSISWLIHAPASQLNTNFHINFTFTGSSSSRKTRQEKLTMWISLLILSSGIITPLIIIVLVPTVYLLELCLLPFMVIQQFGMGGVINGCTASNLSPIYGMISVLFDLFFLSMVTLIGLPLLTHFLAFSVLYMIYSLDKELRY
jgi:hypothetical protein